MAKITYAKRSYECLDGETVLESLARHGVALASKCRVGSCHTCLAKATEGTPPAEAQEGLEPQLKAQGYFLPCICKPVQDLGFANKDEQAASPQISASVVGKASLNDKIMGLRLKPDTPFAYQAGQFLNIQRNDGLSRSYSIASQPQDGFIELQIEHIKNGKMSSWFKNEVARNTRVTIDGPHGDCFYVAGNPAQNLLLIGTSTGLAPLWGIVHAALNKGHTGEIHLFHGGTNINKLYLVDKLEQLAAKHANFHYTPCISGKDTQGFEAGRVNDIALRQHSRLNGWQVYLCGHPAMVEMTRNQAVRAGASSSNIHADAFTPSK